MYKTEIIPLVDERLKETWDRYEYEIYGIYNKCKKQYWKKVDDLATQIEQECETLWQVNKWLRENI